MIGSKIVKYKDALGTGKWQFTMRTPGEIWALSTAHQHITLIQYSTIVCCGRSFQFKFANQFFFGIKSSLSSA